MWRQPQLTLSLQPPCFASLRLFLHLWERTMWRGGRGSFPAAAGSPWVRVGGKPGGGATPVVGGVKGKGGGGALGGAFGVLKGPGAPPAMTVGGGGGEL